MSFDFDLNEYAKQHMNNKKVAEQAEQQDHISLLQEISKLFDHSGKFTDKAKKHWFKRWLQINNYDPKFSAKDMTREQLLHLKGDVEVLNIKYNLYY